MLCTASLTKLPPVIANRVTINRKNTWRTHTNVRVNKRPVGVFTSKEKILAGANYLSTIITRRIDSIVTGISCSTVYLYIILNDSTVIFMQFYSGLIHIRLPGVWRYHGLRDSGAQGLAMSSPVLVDHGYNLSWYQACH